jgi:hypothetical protein
VVAHPRHDSFIGDPMHVRPLMPMTFQLFSRKNNLEWQRMKAANSPLALHHSVDFEVVDTTMILDEPYVSDLKSGKLSAEDLEPLLRRQNNVVSEFRIKLKVIK